MGDIQLIKNFTCDAIVDDRLKHYYDQFLIDKRDQVTGYDQLFRIYDEITTAGIRRSGKVLWFIAYQAEIVGFVTFSRGFLPYQMCIGISDFFIDKPYRQQGIGRRAFNMIVGSLFAIYPTAERIGLAVFSGNTAAKTLYASMGFTNTLEVMVLEKPRL